MILLFSFILVNLKFCDRFNFIIKCIISVSGTTYEVESSKDSSTPNYREQNLRRTPRFLWRKGNGYVRYSNDEQWVLIEKITNNRI